MRKYVIIAVDLVVIALIAGSMLSGQPLWKHSEAAPLASSTSTLTQIR